MKSLEEQLQELKHDPQTFKEARREATLLHILRHDYTLEDAKEHFYTSFNTITAKNIGILTSYTLGVPVLITLASLALPDTPLTFWTAYTYFITGGLLGFQLGSKRFERYFDAWDATFRRVTAKKYNQQ